MLTFTNDRSGESVKLDMDRKTIAAKFAESADDDSWIWFWLAKQVKAAEAGPCQSSLVGLMFMIAIGYGLKRPRITAKFNGYRYQLYLSRRGTLCVKVARYIGENQVSAANYIGCFWQGQFLPNRNAGPLLTTHQDFVDRVYADPIPFLAECSKDLGTCCYCNKPLTTDASKAAGYGAICASRWGLPYGKDYDEKSPGYMRLLGDDVLVGALEIAKDDPDGWLVAADRLEEMGLPRVKAPNHGVVLPA